MLRTFRVAGVALALAGALAGHAVAHEGNPNYRSEVLSVPEGIEASVLNFDDRIELRNESGATVLVRGYRGEPYLRFGADGTVAVNTRSPAAHLNEDRFAQVEVPESADPEAEPAWRTVARNGRYDWHDHRIHWMSQTPPERVRADESARVVVFDWELPLELGTEPAIIAGRLTWLGEEDGGFPLAAALSLVAAALAGAVLVWIVRRRRRPDAVKDEAW